MITVWELLLNLSVWVSLKCRSHEANYALKLGILGNLSLVSVKGDFSISYRCPCVSLVDNLGNSLIIHQSETGKITIVKEVWTPRLS